MKPTREPFPSHAFDDLAATEGHHWWFNARRKILLWVLRSKVPKFHNYLEIGCGTGYVLEGVSQTFPHATINASEYYEEGLVFARQRVPDANFVRIDAIQMREENYYDLIGIYDVIEHIERDDLVLANIARALRPGGSAVITVPQHEWLWSPVDEHACHVRRYRRSDLIQKVNNAGLKVSYVTSFVALLLPLMIVARLRAKKDEYDPKSEFYIPKSLNLILSMVMTIEIFFLNVGIRLPIGGSLLLIATKDKE